MFHLKSLELVHWDYWQRLALPLNANIVGIVGPNGSGKTTLLDALRTLFAIKCSGRRDWKHYARHADAPFAWIRAVVGNDKGGGRQYAYPFWPLTDAEVTLACRIRKQGGDWVRQYLIEGGALSIEDLEARAAKGGGELGVNDYKRRLESAGLTHAITEVLALEQGDTDKLCEYSPTQLLKLVFTVFGDQAVLDDYQAAKNDQSLSERELEEAERKLAALENRVETARTRARNHEEWRGLTRQRQTLVGEILPRLRFAEVRESIQGGRSQLAGLKRQLLATRTQSQQATEILESRRTRLAQVAKERSDAQESANALQAEFQTARDAVVASETVLRQQQQLLHLARQEGADVGETLTRLRREKRELEDERTRLRERLQNLEDERNLLHAGQRPAAEFVRRFRAALDEAGIAHRLLADIVEVTDPAWQGAVEALLAAYRHIILIDRPGQREQAWRLGERLGYRHFVVADLAEAATADPASLLAVLRFTRPAPAWMAQHLNRVLRVADVAEGTRLAEATEWVTPAGYHKERRGARHLGLERGDWQFGEAARKARLDALREENQALETRMRNIGRLLVELTQRIAPMQAQLEGYDAARQLMAREAEFDEAATRLPLEQARADELGIRLAEALSALERAREAWHVADTGLRDAQRNRQEAERERIELETQSRSQREEQCKRYQVLRQSRRGMPPAWRKPEALSALAQEFDPETGQAVIAQRVAGQRLKDIETQLNRDDWETDPVCLAVRDKLIADLAADQSNVEQRRRDLDRARNITSDARAAYIAKLRATVRRYQKNIRQLGELAGIGVECAPPHLENDDLTLAQAGLVVRFDFDRKGFQHLSDGEASGGQQVMKSLILLVGMMMDEERPGGFVFIDEPFAHLDIFNIDRVGGFLQATRAQYLITSPVTHNLNVHDPAELVLMTRKKPPGERWAPPIAVLQRQSRNP